jgi:hypothetical protein
MVNVSKVKVFGYFLLVRRREGSRMLKRVLHPGELDNLLSSALAQPGSKVSIQSVIIGIFFLFWNDGRTSIILPMTKSPTSGRYLNNKKASETHYTL